MPLTSLLSKCTVKRGKENKNCSIDTTSFDFDIQSTHIHPHASGSDGKVYQCGDFFFLSYGSFLYIFFAFQIE